VLLAQGDGEFDRGLERRRRAPAAAPVGRPQVLRIRQSGEALEQVADGVDRELEFGGDLVDLLALLLSEANGLAQGEGKGTRHGDLHKNGVNDSASNACR
jgi:hypothetical protein